LTHVLVFAQIHLTVFTFTFHHLPFVIKDDMGQVDIGCQGNQGVSIVNWLLSFLLWQHTY